MCREFAVRAAAFVDTSAKRHLSHWSVRISTAFALHFDWLVELLLTLVLLIPMALHDVCEQRVRFFV